MKNFESQFVPSLAEECQHRTIILETQTKLSHTPNKLSTKDATKTRQHLNPFLISQSFKVI